MKTKRIGSKNAHIVTCDNGAQILFSYITPVAMYDPERGYFRTSHKYSQTTTRHVNGWASYVGEATEHELMNFAFRNMGDLPYLAAIQGRLWSERTGGFSR